MGQAISKARILIVDDSAVTLDVMERNLSALGYEVSKALSADQAMERLAAGPLDLVITDLRMPGMSGLELVRHVRENLADTAVMMITGYATIEGAVEAIKTGAEEYLAKPFTDEELKDAVERVLGKLETARARKTHAEGGRFGLVGDSGPFRRALASLRRAIRQGGPILLLGEPGSGRWAVARAAAMARGGPGVPILALEGSALGPIAVSAWAEHISTGGAVYVKGVDRASPEDQERVFDLLSAPPLPEGSVLLSAAPGLFLMVEQGLFRGDLFSTLTANSVLLPPLKERGEDALLLAGHFLAELAHRLGASQPRLSAGACDALRGYPWPGNVEELYGIVLAVFGRAEGGIIEARDLPIQVREASPATSTFKTLAEVETEHIRKALAVAEGRKGRAAKSLGIDRKTLREKLKALGE